MSQARGLTVFISDLCNCTNPEQERKRVEKEMHRECTRLAFAFLLR